MSSWILTAKNSITIHMATVCCTYACGFNVQKSKLQLPKQFFRSAPSLFICLHFILLTAHEKGCSTLWIFSASKEDKNAVVGDILFALCSTYAPNVHANDLVAGSVYTGVSSSAPHCYMKLVLSQLITTGDSLLCTFCSLRAIG